MPNPQDQNAGAHVVATSISAAELVKNRVAVSVKEFAALTGVPEQTVYSYVHTGKLRSVKTGASIRIPVSELKKYTHAGEAGTKARAGEPEPSDSEPLTPEMIGNLERGDVVRHESGNEYIVLRTAQANHGSALAIREATVTSGEWVLVRKHGESAGHGGLLKPVPSVPARLEVTRRH